VGEESHRKHMPVINPSTTWQPMFHSGKAEMGCEYQVMRACGVGEQSACSKMGVSDRG